MVLRENPNHLRIISKQAELKTKKIDRPLLFSDLPFFENILLLQGPVGPFFSNLRYFYKNRGSKVFKINFNFGSQFFYKPDEYTFTFSDFEINFQFYIKNFLIKNKINAVFLFSNKRFFHSIAINEAKELGIQIYSLEEGYMRPNYFTLEKKGNNLDSPIINIDPYKLSDETFNYKPQPYKNFLPMCFNATLYWFFSYIKNYEFPYYRHHRDLNFARGLNWVRGFFRFVKYEITEFFIRYKLKKETEKKYFLCILQVFDDFQVTKNSHYKSIEQYLEEVLISFVNYKKNNISNDVLLIKHHPMDIGEKNYSEFIKYCANRLNIKKDIIYFHNIRYLSNIYSIIKGAVTINSTLGLKLLLNDIPVINLSKSFYNKPGLTYQGSLEDFWINPLNVDSKVVKNYINYLLKTTQVNGCLYSSEYKIS